MEKQTIENKEVFIIDSKERKGKSIIAELAQLAKDKEDIKEFLSLVFPKQINKIVRYKPK